MAIPVFVFEDDLVVSKRSSTGEALDFGQLLTARGHAPIHGQETLGAVAHASCVARGSALAVASDGGGIRPAVAGPLRA
jgi:hypothetical protein